MLGGPRIEYLKLGPYKVYYLQGSVTGLLPTLPGHLFFFCIFHNSPMIIRPRLYSIPFKGVSPSVLYLSDVRLISNLDTNFDYLSDMVIHLYTHIYVYYCVCIGFHPDHSPWLRPT